MEKGPHRVGGGREEGGQGGGRGGGLLIDELCEQIAAVTSQQSARS